MKVQVRDGRGNSPLKPSDFAKKAFGKLNLRDLHGTEIYWAMCIRADRMHRDACPGAARVSMAAMTALYLPLFKRRRNLGKIAVAYDCSPGNVSQRIKKFKRMLKDAHESIGGHIYGEGKNNFLQ